MPPRKCLNGTRCNWTIKSINFHQQLLILNGKLKIFHKWKIILRFQKNKINSFRQKIQEKMPEKLLRYSNYRGPGNVPFSLCSFHLSTCQNNMIHTDKQSKINIIETACITFKDRVCNQTKRLSEVQLIWNRKKTVKNPSRRDTTIYSDANNIYLRKNKMSAHGYNDKSRHVFSGLDATRLGIFTSSNIQGDLDYQTTPKHDLEVL